MCTDTLYELDARRQSEGDTTALRGTPDGAHIVVVDAVTVVVEERKGASDELIWACRLREGQQASTSHEVIIHADPALNPYYYHSLVYYYQGLLRDVIIPLPLPLVLPISRLIGGQGKVRTTQHVPCKFVRPA
jgi:hypothetical protein